MGIKKTSGKDDQNLIFPLISFDNFVLTPMIPQPVKIETDEQKEYLDRCCGSNSEIFIATNDPSPEHKDKLMNIGVVAIVDRVLLMPGAPSLAFVRPLFRASFVSTIFNPAFPMARVKRLKDIVLPKKETKENFYLNERIQNLFNLTLQFAGEPEKSTAEKIISENGSDPVRHLYAISHVAPINLNEKYKVLECNTYSSLLKTLALVLDQAEQRISLQASIHERTHQELTQQQREMFLRTHLKHVQEELGEVGGDDSFQLTQRAAQKQWDRDTNYHFDKELQKLRRLNINSPEYSVQYGYLEEFLDLPWRNYLENKISIDKVEEILNRDHYGLQHVKERILEYMAVISLRNDLKAPIICLVGPPGVGKTSIGKSVAEATGREYARIALGGMHDESEIRGHRRTYIGAMPGRIIHSLSKLKYGNPLILLDEIDKVGKDFKGDPSSALLEALDPEQNSTFHDNFIDYPYDLSKVLFIATANDLASIPSPLKDRMEVIEMPKYSLEEKREIALRHLVDKALEDNGFNKGDIKFTPEAITTIIRLYTHEAGVRQLAKKLGAIIRKLALLKVRGEEIPLEINEELAKKFLGKKDSSESGLGFK